MRTAHLSTCCKGDKRGLNSGDKLMQLVIVVNEKALGAEKNCRKILERQINLARKCEIDEVFILSEHLASNMKEYFGNGEKFGVKIYHVVVPYALGTGGCLKLIQDKLKDRFMVLCDDVPEGFDLSSFIEFDRGCNSIGTMAVRENNTEKLGDFYLTKWTYSVKDISSEKIIKEIDKFLSNNTCQTTTTISRKEGICDFEQRR